MPDDVGGKPFQDGWEPDDDRGGADEEFASVVFGEDFVRAATYHEPSAVERLLAAAEARAEAEAAKARAGGPGGDDDHFDEYDEFLRENAAGYGLLHGPGGGSPAGGPDDGESGPYGLHGGALRPYRGRARWHRPVAWLLALVMGIGMVALAFAAVYRGASASRQDQVPAPVTTGVDAVPGGPGISRQAPSPSVAAGHSMDHSAAPAPVLPGTP
ncbi:SCO2584 family spore wall biosynthesis protein [Streptomyces sp. NBC_00388]|uniref:SCO2584 family spore wall biosynthesis protein n=1 Tax=Streptomyces sp. NBC_00388 TaxID=2975735 RepID=UPI002E232A48